MTKHECLTQLEDNGKSSPKWLRLALAAIPIVAALAGLMVWQPWDTSSGFQNVMVKAQAATAGLQSYRISTVHTDNTEEVTSEVEIEFSAPDRYHVKQMGDMDNLEYILIGDERYYKDSYPSVFMMETQASAYLSMLSSEAALRGFDYLTDVRKFPDETVDGTVYLHYQGTYDYEKQLRSILESDSRSGRPPISNERMEKELEELRSSGRSTTTELWIGRDAYLIRQMKTVNQSLDDKGAEQSSSVDFKFYDFNQVIVKAPTDSSGELLPGWTSTSPEYPHFGTDIHADVDNYNPSDRKVNFTVNINNISAETLTDVDVRIHSVFPEPYKNPDAKIWFSWDNGQHSKGPYILETGETLKYSCTFGYDATSISQEAISETITKSYVRVAYIKANGQQKEELFHLEAPESIYSLSTDMPPHLVPVELTTSGEYRIEEPGATYTGNGGRGKINGREYLFVEINTPSAEVPTPPGILVLDIQDKTKPKKVAYLNTNDDTRYISGATLYDTILYVSTDDSLWIIDVSDPTVPRELSRIPGLDANQMIISGTHAFINDGNHDIVTLDLSDPVNPERIGSLPLSSSSGIRLDIYGEYLLAEANDVLYAIDASSPSSLEIVNEHSFKAPIDDATPEIIYPYHIMGTEIENGYAYVTLSTEGKVAIGVLDISEPASPREIAFFRLKDRSFNGSLFPSGDRVYMFTSKSFGQDRRKRLEIIDISDPANPVELGFGILPDSWSFFSDSSGGYHQTFNLIDDYLYWFIGDSPNLPVIEIFDLSGL